MPQAVDIVSNFATEVVHRALGRARVEAASAVAAEACSPLVHLPLELWQLISQHGQLASADLNSLSETCTELLRVSRGIIPGSSREVKIHDVGLPGGVPQLLLYTHAWPRIHFTVCFNSLALFEQMLPQLSNASLYGIEFRPHSSATCPILPARVALSN